MSNSGKRVFLIVLDSFGIGELPDAGSYGDTGSNTLEAVFRSRSFFMPNMQKLGLFNIDGVRCGEKCGRPEGAFARMTERSRGKDTTIGHWEIAGIYSPTPMPVFPDGFPQEFISKFEKAVGRRTLCNKPYSGTKVIADYGDEHISTGALIVYTSADSVFQIAAHEDVVPVEELYRICENARGLLTGNLAVGRVIARPFIGKAPNFTRTSNRRDFSLLPPRPTMLDAVKDAQLDVVAIGKISDIFAGRGVTRAIHTTGNADGMTKTLEAQQSDFSGLCFVNLVDFDMLYGHRNDVDGYAAALSAFDAWLPDFIGAMRGGDILMITADHGCDPSTPSTDHSREYTPLVIAGACVEHGTDLGTRPTFSDISATVLDYLGCSQNGEGTSLLPLFTR